MGTLTPGPSPDPSRPPSPGEGRQEAPGVGCAVRTVPRHPRGAQRTLRSAPKKISSIPDRFFPPLPVREGARGRERGPGGEGPGGGRLFCFSLLLLALSTLACRAAEPPALIDLSGKHVTLKILPPDRNRPEIVRLAAELDRAAGEMAPRVPVEISTPVTVVVEPDYVAQGQHTGEIGEAVPGRTADLHLVYHPDDLPAYRYALAEVLLGRSGLVGKTPPELARGAALWLSRDWYGRSYPDWLPLLAAAGVLPSAEEILAGEEPPDGSRLLTTPAAAAVVERLPGDTTAAKLAHPPETARVREILAGAGKVARPASPTKASRLPFLKGVSLAMLNRLEEGYHAPSVDRQLDNLARMGADSVSLMPFAFQRGPDRPELRFFHRHPAGETDIGLIHAARSAHAHGFKVLWKPHIWVGRASWPGEITMKSEADWGAWWRSYRRYVLHHALLARWAGADLFCAGVELSGTAGREAEWRDLIAAVRAFYPGPVTYASNWYNDLENVRFWDRLDLIGVDAYFPLAVQPGADRDAREKGARQVVDRLAAASKRWGKPVLLTEVGFAAKKEAWREPHREGGDYSEEDQAAAYEALFKALGRPPWLAGTFLWKAFSGPGSDGRHEADFRFQGRKAEGVVRGYYGH